jgi:hypothetical protein
MKKSKMGLLALASILGVAGAYASKPAHFNGTTYYAVSDGLGGFTWTKVKPIASQFTCQLQSNQYCTVITIGGYAPQTNVVPSSTQATPTSSTHRVYKAVL